MTTPDTDAPDDWGSRGREHQARRTEAGTPKGRAYARQLESLPVAEAAGEVRSMFAETATEDLAVSIAADLQIDSERAEAIAEEIAARRRRLATAVCPFPRQFGAKD